MRRLHLTAFAVSLLLGLAALAPGCATYSERVGCSNGEVLDESDQCVPPPPPDGGVAIATCPELCAALGGFSADGLTCIETNLGGFGPTPAECMDDLRQEAVCTACVGALGLDDPTCATAGSVCQ